MINVLFLQGMNAKFIAFSEKWGALEKKFKESHPRVFLSAQKPKLS